MSVEWTRIGLICACALADFKVGAPETPIRRVGKLATKIDDRDGPHGPQNQRLRRRWDRLRALRARIFLADVNERPETARSVLRIEAEAQEPRSWHSVELRNAYAAAQRRIVSEARIRLDSRKSVRPFKGIFATAFLSSSLTCPATQCCLFGLCPVCKNTCDQSPATD
jgi:hypothetical protein